MFMSSVASDLVCPFLDGIEPLDTSEFHNALNWIFYLYFRDIYCNEVSSDQTLQLSTFKTALATLPSLRPMENWLSSFWIVAHTELHTRPDTESPLYFYMHLWQTVQTVMQKYITSQTSDIAAAALEYLNNSTYYSDGNLKLAIPIIALSTKSSFHFSVIFRLLMKSTNAACYIADIVQCCPASLSLVFPLLLDFMSLNTVAMDTSSNDTVIPSIDEASVDTAPYYVCLLVFCEIASRSCRLARWIRAALSRSQLCASVSIEITRRGYIQNQQPCASLWQTTDNFGHIVRFCNVLLGCEEEEKHTLLPLPSAVVIADDSAVPWWVVDMSLDEIFKMLSENLSFWHARSVTTKENTSFSSIQAANEAVAPLRIAAVLLLSLPHRTPLCEAKDDTLTNQWKSFVAKIDDVFRQYLSIFEVEDTTSKRNIPEKRWIQTLDYLIAVVMVAIISLYNSTMSTMTIDPSAHVDVTKILCAELLQLINDLLSTKSLSSSSLYKFQKGNCGEQLNLDTIKGLEFCLNTWYFNLTVYHKKYEFLRQWIIGTLSLPIAVTHPVESVVQSKILLKDNLFRIEWIERIYVILQPNGQANGVSFRFPTECNIFKSNFQLVCESMIESFDAGGGVVEKVKRISGLNILLMCLHNGIDEPTTILKSVLLSWSKCVTLLLQTRSLFSSDINTGKLPNSSFTVAVSSVRTLMLYVLCENPSDSVGDAYLPNGHMASLIDEWLLDCFSDSEVNLQGKDNGCTAAKCWSPCSIVVKELPHWAHTVLPIDVYTHMLSSTAAPSWKHVIAVYVSLKHLDNIFHVLRSRRTQSAKAANAATWKIRRAGGSGYVINREELLVFRGVDVQKLPVKAVMRFLLEELSSARVNSSPLLGNVKMWYSLLQVLVQRWCLEVLTINAQLSTCLSRSPIKIHITSDDSTSSNVNNCDAVTSDLADFEAFLCWYQHSDHQNDPQPKLRNVEFTDSLRIPHIVAESDMVKWFLVHILTAYLELCEVSSTCHASSSKPCVLNSRIHRKVVVLWSSLRELVQHPWKLEMASIECMSNLSSALYGHNPFSFRLNASELCVDHILVKEPVLLFTIIAPEFWGCGGIKCPILFHIFSSVLMHHMAASEMKLIRSDVLTNDKKKTAVVDTTIESGRARSYSSLVDGDSNINDLADSWVSDENAILSLSNVVLQRLMVCRLLYGGGSLVQAMYSDHDSPLLADDVFQLQVRLCSLIQELVCDSVAVIGEIFYELLFSFSNDASVQLDTTIPPTTNSKSQLSLISWIFAYGNDVLKVHLELLLLRELKICMKQLYNNGIDTSVSNNCLKVVNYVECWLSCDGLGQRSDNIHQLIMILTSVVPPAAQSEWSHTDKSEFITSSMLVSALMHYSSFNVEFKVVLQSLQHIITLLLTCTRWFDDDILPIDSVRVMLSKLDALQKELAKFRRFVCLPAANWIVPVAYGTQNVNPDPLIQLSCLSALYTFNPSDSIVQDAVVGDSVDVKEKDADGVPCKKTRIE